VRGVDTEQPQRGCGEDVTTGHNPVGVAACFNLVSQGGSFLATLGFEPESLWDSQIAHQTIPPAIELENKQVFVPILFESSRFTQRSQFIA